MSYIIDGHNLIPNIPGLSLSQLDDENQLIRLLVTFCRKKRTRAVVFFDKAAVGHHGGKGYGAVSAIFVSDRRKADEAIHDYLASHRGEARNLTVVSSDRQVQQDAKSLHARVISTESFASLLIESLLVDHYKFGNVRTNPLSAEEVTEWERLFGCYDK